MKLDTYRNKIDKEIAIKLIEKTDTKWVDIAKKFGITPMAIFKRRKKGIAYFQAIYDNKKS